MTVTEPSREGFWSRLWRRRPWVQIASLVLTNSWFTREVTKGLPCLALNCYACPLAVTACPIGSIQYFVGIRQIPLYVLGVVGLAGALGGRFACGWLCPFGWLQEQIYRLPVRKWAPKPRTRARWWVLVLVSLPYAAGVWAIQRYTAPATLPLGLYLVAGFVLYGLLGASRRFALIGLVVLLPFYTREPWFTKLCPAGMLEAGIPQVLIEPGLRDLVGPFYWLKLAILVLFLAWMAVTRRPFCRWICPLGTLWSPFNRASTLQMAVNQESCTRCDRCQKVCPVDIRIYEDANSQACVRCMQCVNECPVSCVRIETLLGL
jgi:ferredoxin-type protein NapH